MNRSLVLLSRARIPYLLALAVTASSCSTFNELYHLSGTGESTNYFRVRVSGWSMMSSSQYAAGTYDADAVDALFGELEGKRIAVDRTDLIGHPSRSAPVKDPAAAHPGTPATPDADASLVGATAKKPTDLGVGTGKKLVVFLSTNSDFFVQQISNFVRNSNIQRGLANIILKDEIRELAKVRGQAAPLASETTALAAKLRQSSTALTFVAGQGDAQSAPTQADAERELALVLRRIAYASGDAASASSITDLATARTWLDAHPTAFRIEVTP